MKRILVTGSAGMLGRRILEDLSALNVFSLLGMVHTRSHHVAAVPEARIDLIDGAATDALLADFDPDVIVHCAARVSVDACERDKEYARALHVDACRRLAGHRQGKHTFIYISTDSVFDGRTGNYSETDAPNPLNYYARTKREAEIAALQANPGAVIIRTNIYGFHIPPGLSLFEWAKGRISAGQKVNGYEDIAFNPLYTGQLAGIVVHIINNIERFPAGILHAGSDQCLSKFAFLRMVSEEFGYGQDMVIPSREEFSPLETPRPKNTTLNTARLRALTGAVPSLRDGINALYREYREKFHAGN